MSQKRREKLIRREARRKKVYRPGLSRAEQQAAFEERCAKRKAREAEVKALAEAERTKQRLARDAREQALADAVASAILPAEGGTLRLVGLHDTHRYYYPPIVRVNDRDFIVAEAKNEAGDSWLTLKPKPEPKPGLNDRFAVENGVYVRFLDGRHNPFGVLNLSHWRTRTVIPTDERSNPKIKHSTKMLVSGYGHGVGHAHGLPDRR